VIRRRFLSKSARLINRFFCLRGREWLFVFGRRDTQRPLLQRDSQTGNETVRPAPGHERNNQTSASHCRQDGRVLKIFDWPATRSVYVAIRGEVKRKMAKARPPRFFMLNY
jgi:hypothetical protein